MSFFGFGELISFGSITFTGAGAISTVKSAWPISLDCEFDLGLVEIGTTAYPFDTQGTSAAPFKASPVLTYEYCLLAVGAASDALAFKQVRQQWNQIYTAIMSTYVWNGVSGVSGQKGTLKIADEDPTVLTTYSATARIMKPAPFKLVKGQPSYLSVELPFALLSDFS